MNKFYCGLLVILGFYFSLNFVIALFMLSLLLACIMFARNWFMFFLPIGLLLYCFLFGHVPLALWSIFFTPWHYIAFTSNLVHLVKQIIDID